MNLIEEHIIFSYSAGEVFSLVAADSLGAQVFPNSSLIDFKQLGHSILKLVLLDVSIHLERERTYVQKRVVSEVKVQKARPTVCMSVSKVGALVG